MARNKSNYNCCRETNPSSHIKRIIPTVIITDSRCHRKELQIACKDVVVTLCPWSSKESWDSPLIQKFRFWIPLGTAIWKKEAMPIMWALEVCPSLSVWQFQVVLIIAAMLPLSQSTFEGLVKFKDGNPWSPSVLPTNTKNPAQIDHASAGRRPISECEMFLGDFQKMTEVATLITTKSSCISWGYTNK